MQHLWVTEDKNQTQKKQNNLNFLDGFHFKMHI